MYYSPQKVSEGKQASKTANETSNILRYKGTH